VSLAIEAADALEGDLNVRVVSMPCMDRFDEQDDEYRDSVLPPSVRARVAVEAASPFGWDRWIGPDGAFVGMSTFGESGPAKDVYAHFGITAERVADLARQAADRVGTRSG
jgi:transketolase